MNRKTIAGIEFEAIRETKPIPHWRARVVATGYTYEPGCFKSHSRPALWESIEYTAKRRGEELFAVECLEAHLSRGEQLARLKRPRPGFSLVPHPRGHVLSHIANGHFYETAPLAVTDERTIAHLADVILDAVRWHALGRDVSAAFPQVIIRPLV